MALSRRATIGAVCHGMSGFKQATSKAKNSNKAMTLQFLALDKPVSVMVKIFFQDTTVNRSKVV